MLRRGFPKIQIRHFAKKAQKQKKNVVSSDSYDMEKLRSQFTRTMTGFEKEMSKLRSGRPDASMLNHIQVDAYGDKQPLPSVGQVVLKSEREITINVFDASIKDDVAKAISLAPVGAAASCRRTASDASIWWITSPWGTTHSWGIGRRIGSLSRQCSYRHPTPIGLVRSCLSMNSAIRLPTCCGRWQAACLRLSTVVSWPF